MKEIETLRSWLEESRQAVFFGGAGVSTESGIPDFRSETGLYKQKFAYPAEVMLSHEFFMRKTAEFYDFYRTVMLYPDAEPNAAHKALARLEREGHLAACVTQNIDGLHQKAGSHTVYELHGSVLRNTCQSCRRAYGLDAILNSMGIPHCPVCGGILKPDVVLYGENLDDDVVAGAIAAIERADLLIIGGTSLNVYPAAGLIGYYRGTRLVLCNLEPTPQDRRADLIIHRKLGEVLTEVCGGAL